MIDGLLPFPSDIPVPKKRGRKRKILPEDVKREQEERRRQLNKASACESRIRKKCQVAELQAEYARLQGHKDNLLKEIEALQAATVSPETVMIPMQEDFSSSSSSSSSPSSMSDMMTDYTSFEGLMKSLPPIPRFDLDSSSSLLEFPFQDASRDGLPECEAVQDVDMMTAKSAVLVTVPPQLEQVIMSTLLSCLIAFQVQLSFQMESFIRFQEFLMSKRIPRDCIARYLEILKIQTPHRTRLEFPPIIRSSQSSMCPSYQTYYSMDHHQHKTSGIGQTHLPEA
jgi:hypothetical protein